MKTVLPAKALAKKDFRLVPNQRPDDILAKLQTHLAAQGFGDVQVTKLGSGDPVITPLEGPFVQRIAQICQAFTGQDVRFTTKPGGLNAIALAWPGKTFTVKALGTGAAHANGRVTGVRLLGHEGALAFTQDAAGLHVTLPAKSPGEHAFAFRIEGVS